MAKTPAVILRALEKAASVHARVEAQLARLNAKIAPRIEGAESQRRTVENDSNFWQKIVMDIVEERRKRKLVNRKNARKPRSKRPTTLAMRGLHCVLRENPDITAKTLIEWLEHQPRTYDDDDIEISFDGAGIVVRDLSPNGATKTLKESNLRVSLQRARNS